MIADPLPPEYSFDLDKWLPVFPEAEEIEIGLGSCVGSPGSLVYVERIRRQVFSADDPCVPADIFVLALGEPGRRDVTKVGGLPYRSATAPWPCNARGEPCTFLAQYRFTESVKLVPRLPGDLLLIFTGEDYLEYTDDMFFFEWQKLGIKNLVAQDDVPKPAWTFVKCYGVRHRTVDYLLSDLTTAKKRLKSFGNREEPIPDMDAMSTYWLNGMKIGGMPSWLDLEDPYVETFSRKRFLCSLPTIVPPYGPYPWANHPDPIPLLTYSRDTELIWYDGFTLYFFIESDNEINWRYQLG